MFEEPVDFNQFFLKWALGTDFSAQSRGGMDGGEGC